MHIEPHELEMTATALSQYIKRQTEFVAARPTIESCADRACAIALRNRILSEISIRGGDILPLIWNEKRESA